MGLDRPAASQARPSFGSLFDVCACGNLSCAACGGWQLTPRTACVLWNVLGVLADNGYDDVIEHGDEPVTQDGGWSLFDRYPRVTWTQDAVWRRQAARACDDLAADVEAGRWPSPTRAAEELALHLALQDAPAAVADWWAGRPEGDTALPEHPDDFDWDMCSEMLLQDEDILSLFKARLDGIEDPDDEMNREIGMGDYRPAAWFTRFGNANPRDGRRPFRR